jgi:hypothetical protein
MFEKYCYLLRVPTDTTYIPFKNVTMQLADAHNTVTVGKLYLFSDVGKSSFDLILTAGTCVHNTRLSSLYDLNVCFLIIDRQRVDIQYK